MIAFALMGLMDPPEWFENGCGETPYCTHIYNADLQGRGTGFPPTPCYLPSTHGISMNMYIPSQKSHIKG